MSTVIANNKKWLIRYLVNKNASYYNPNKLSLIKAGSQFELIKKYTSTTSSSKGHAVSIPNLSGNVQLKSNENEEKAKLDLTFENSKLVCFTFFKDWC
jgi:hypothetical protein